MNSKTIKKIAAVIRFHFLQIIVPFSLTVPWGLVNDGLKTIESFRMAYRVCGQKVNARYIM